MVSIKHALKTPKVNLIVNLLINLINYSPLSGPFKRVRRITFYRGYSIWYVIICVISNNIQFKINPRRGNDSFATLVRVLLGPLTLLVCEITFWYCIISHMNSFDEWFQSMNYWTFPLLSPNKGNGIGHSPNEIKSQSNLELKLPATRISTLVSKSVQGE